MESVKRELANRKFWYPLRAAQVAVKQTLPDERGIDFERKLIDMERKAEVGSMCKVIRARIVELDAAAESDHRNAAGPTAAGSPKAELRKDPNWWMLPQEKTRVKAKKSAGTRSLARRQ